MRLDVFDKRNSGILSFRTKVVPSVSGQETVARRPTPNTESTCNEVPEARALLEQSLGDPSSRPFRCLTRHARWALVHSLTHKTTH